MKASIDMHSINMTHGMLVSACKNLQKRRKARPALIDWTQEDIDFSAAVNNACRVHGYASWRDVLKRKRRG